MKSNQGFTLIEVMIALIIMAIIGIMTWRGLDGSLRSKEIIEQHIEEHKAIQTLITYWQSDCKGLTTGLDAETPNFVKGNKNFWLLKHVSSINAQGWQIITYTIANNKLQRLQSRVYSSKNELETLWLNAVKEPDLGVSNLQVSFDLDGISSQMFQAKYQNQITASTLKSVLLGIEASWQFSAYPNRLTSSCLIENQL
jgi:general secretion pathway protein J